MKSQDLRIGNFIKVSRFNVDIPARIETYDDLYQISMGELKASGEPLTEEWLIKFKYPSFENGYYNITDEIIISVEGQVYAEFDDNKRIWIAECYHIHSLQNLHKCLTGQELTISE